MSKNYERIDELRKWYSRQEMERRKESAKENENVHSSSKEKLSWMRVTSKEQSNYGVKEQGNYGVKEQGNYGKYEKGVGEIWKKSHYMEFLFYHIMSN